MAPFSVWDGNLPGNIVVSLKSSVTYVYVNAKYQGKAWATSCIFFVIYASLDVFFGGVLE